MGFEKEMANFKMTASKIELNILFEINNKETELLDNVKLVSYLKDSHVLTEARTIKEKEFKKINTDFKNYLNKFKEVSKKVANL
jgi:hypothetical protein